MGRIRKRKPQAERTLSTTTTGNDGLLVPDEVSGRRACRGLIPGESNYSENNTLATLLFPGPAEEGCPCRILEDLANAFTTLGGAFQVMLGTNLLSYCHTLFRRDRPLRRLPQIINRLLVPAEIFLAADKDDWEILTEMHDLGNPLLLYVIQRVGAVDGKANQDNV